MIAEKDIRTLKTDSFVEILPAKKPPEISMLMHVYQQSDYVSSAVRSVLAQRGVVAEVIISDDASTDDTLTLAYQAVREMQVQGEFEHRVVMRRGSKRLGRDHLPLLVDQAVCDLVCQAHGDDESHPDRAQTLVRIFKSDPQVTMLVSETCTMDAKGKMKRKQHPLPAEIETARYPFDTILHGEDKNLIGCTQAWRKSAVSRFRRLDRMLSATSHDRILAFRAALAGSVCLVRAQLVKRRRHSSAWSKTMFKEPGRLKFGWGLARLTALEVMKQDLQEAYEAGLVDKHGYDELFDKIDEVTTTRMQQLLHAYREYSREGWQIAWTRDQEPAATINSPTAENLLKKLFRKNR